MLPARAGMIPCQAPKYLCSMSAPRTSGDDPGFFELSAPIQECSPHERG